MKKFIVSIFTLAWITTLQAQSNAVAISSTDDSATIIRKAANITPSARQLRWQQLEVVGFLHFTVNTFTDREWGLGNESEKVFNPAELDAKQWIRTCKAAGIKQ